MRAWWRPRSGCLTRQLGSAGGRARAERRCGWPPPGWCTWPELTCAGRVAIAAGLADAGIASEPAALAYDLAFLPLTAEHFDLVIPAGHKDTREVQGLLKVLSSAWLLDQLASVPGYDLARCGEHIATLPSHRQRSGRPRLDDRHLKAAE